MEKIEQNSDFQEHLGSSGGWPRLLGLSILSIRLLPKDLELAPDDL
jgi:hypothetical protein